MATLTTVADIAKHDGEVVELRGWLYIARSSGKIAFLQLRDGTGIIQCVVVKANVPEDMFMAAKKAGQESSLIVKGLVKADTRSKIGFEIQAESVEVVQDATGYPISPKEHGTAFLFTKRHLWLRSKRTHAILKIRHLCIKGIRDYFDNRG